MPRDYDEKRDFIRVEVDCDIRFKPQGSEQEAIGRLANLSGRGLMFIAANEIPVDTQVEIYVESDPQINAPLHAVVRVVRMAKQRRGDGYEIGAIITSVLDEE
ncbi:PilZ domain-containing protein [Thiohalophilus thiocyanatoxydans]|uniref:PilZ domain-containing protein n=1 Tax=Thiohalophilus thiocyanatoxydans TaxID=381308 RepID=A0A4R8ISR4_9GAMM|nr:PilZ domain-containing protein [Thiohalophilus thiocyanatoxydans]TDY02410.1 PilZ domain-containing protein [Thiohalophilus thiocyanatoxydans]